MDLNIEVPIPADFQDIIELKAKIKCVYWESDSFCSPAVYERGGVIYNQIDFAKINFGVLNQKVFMFAFEQLQRKMQDVIDTAVHLGIEQQKLNELNDFYNSQRKVLQNA